MGDVNRANKRVQKKGKGCKMCKPHKGKWAHRFRAKERQVLGLMYMER